MSSNISEEETYMYLEEMLKELKEAIKDNKSEALSNIRKLKEKITSNNENLKTVSNLIEKADFFNNDIQEAINKIISYNYDEKLLKYLKLFTNVADKTYITYSNNASTIYFLLNVSNSKHIEFANIYINFAEKQNYNITLSYAFDVNSSIEEINKALLNILSNAEYKIKEENKEENNEEDNL